MISINNFGWRLGNQLFQIATAENLARENGDRVAYPVWDYAKYFAGDFTPKQSKAIFVHREHGFHYSPIPYAKNLAIEGYFQSEKYFSKNSSYVREMFTLKPEYAVKIVHNDNFPTCFIHVRRGDYLNHYNHHPILNMDYYNEAISYINTQEDEVRYFVFSDDHAWCMEVFSNYNNVTVMMEDMDIRHFSMMKSCDHAIIANSSFSWWAAWLNNNATQIVVAPKDERWFGPALSHYSVNDIYCDGWIKI